MVHEDEMRSRIRCFGVPCKPDQCQVEENSVPRAQAEDLRREKEFGTSHYTDRRVQRRMQNWQELVHVVKVDVEQLLYMLPTE